MAVSTRSLNKVNLDSFFQERILDNNNISVTDINAGLRNLFSFFNQQEPQLAEDQRYLVHEFEEGFPDLVAKHSVLGDQKYWWWILLANRLEDPMKDIKANWMYSILNQNNVRTFINNSNENADSNNNNKLGSIVELN